MPRTKPAGARQNSADFRLRDENKYLGDRELVAVVVMIGNALFASDSQEFLTLVEVRKCVSN